MDRIGRGGNQRGSFSLASARFQDPARAKLQGERRPRCWSTSGSSGDKNQSIADP